ncbi:MAG: MATE family efflux transporter [Chloroflexi bacterium]|nr:MATE family efflux transporter [Chloroflexota bacterium]
MKLPNLSSPFQRLLDFYSDREYFNQLWKLVLPIAAQNFTTSSLNMVSTMMIGQNGETAVASVGLAGQVFFLLNLVLFGLGSGSAMFTAQLWGKRDIVNIRRVLGFCLSLSLIVAGIFFILAFFFPTRVLGIYTEDPAVIALGSQYLKIFSWSYFFFAVSFSFALILRSTGEVKTPVTVSVLALCLNIALAYGLIFGNFGLPALGVLGAAVAGLTARIFECVLLIVVAYRRKLPVAARLNELFDLDFSFFGRIFRPVLPVILNELFWSLGVTTYNAIYAHIGTVSIAAINIFSTVDQMALVLFFAFTSGTSVLVGNRIGAGDGETAYKYAGRSLGLVFVLALLAGLFVYSISGALLSLFKVDPQVLDYAQRLLLVSCSLMWLRSMNAVLIVAIMRAGGDTVFAMFLDGFIIWIVGVPMAWLGAFYFDLPVYIVYLMVMSEEAVKWILGMGRFLSRKWIHDLTRQVSTA